jgi:hypothetical protein
VLDGGDMDVEGGLVAAVLAAADIEVRWADDATP